MDRGLQHCTGGCNLNHPQEKEMQKGKMIIYGGFQIAEKRRGAEEEIPREHFMQRWDQ